MIGKKCLEKISKVNFGVNLFESQNFTIIIDLESFCGWTTKQSSQITYSAIK